MTCSPSGYESQADGSIIFEDFEVESSAGKESVHRHHAATHEDNFYVDDETGERFYDNTAESNDYNNLVDSVGGAEVYNDMLLWAQNNLSAEDIEEYDAVMESGDLNMTNSYVQQLAERYYNQDATDYPSELDEQSEYIFNNVIDREDYQKLQEFVRQNYDGDFIDNFNRIVDSGNNEMLRNVIRQIQSQMY
jgi:hypothetical protein